MVLNRKLTSQLMHAFDFNLEDLEANRNGTLSTTQQQNLSQRAKKLGGGLVIMSVVVVVIFAAVGLYLYSSPAMRTLLGDTALPSMTQSLLAGAVFILVVFTVPLLYLFRQTGGFRKGTVYSVEGSIKIVAYYGRAGPVRLLRVDARRFPIRPEILPWLYEGDRYRIYYIKSLGTLMILSLEPG